MNKMNARRIMLGASLLCIAATVGATTIYKYRLPDGSTLYTQKRPAKGKLLGVIHNPPPTRQQLAEQRAAERKLQDQIARADLLSAQRGPGVARAEAGAGFGTYALAQATPGLPTTLTPLPGERQGTVGGYSRLNDAYWARLRALGLLEEAPSTPPQTEMLFAK